MNFGATIIFLLVPIPRMVMHLIRTDAGRGRPRQGGALGAGRAAARHRARAAMEAALPTAAVAPPSSGDSRRVDVGFGQRTVKAQQQGREWVLKNIFDLGAAGKAHDRDKGPAE